MSMDHWWNDTGREKQIAGRGEGLSHSPFVLHKSHIGWLGI